jgi:hypothetical protein
MDVEVPIRLADKKSIDMLRFFDYVYYRVCKAYSSAGDSNAGSIAFVVVALVQGFNIITLPFLILAIAHERPTINKYFIGLFELALIVLNYIRYVYKDNNNFKVLQERWKTEELNTKHKRGIGVLVYIVLSFGFYLGLAIYIGSKKW